MRGAVLVLLALVPGTAARPPQSEQERAWIESFVPRLESAEAQLAHARRIKRRLGELGREPGTQAEERAFWRSLAVEAYQAVRLYHPGRHGVGAEAAFRAGELLRAAGEDERALVEFSWSAESGQGTEFRARARLEIGHIHRRSGRTREALQAFLDVAADTAAEPFRRDDGWYWAGVVWRSDGRLDEARTAWRRVAEQGADALARIQAYDALGLTWLECGDLEGAAGTLDECLVRVGERALEETLEGERVRNGLLRMRLVEELQRAIEQRRADAGAQGSARKP